MGAIWFWIRLLHFSKQFVPHLLKLSSFGQVQIGCFFLTFMSVDEFQAKRITVFFGFPAPLSTLRILGSAKRNNQPQSAKSSMLDH
jgi:hypothetical protein